MTATVIFDKLKREFQKPTPFLLLSIVGTIFFTYIFFSLLPDQTAGLGAAYALMLILALVVALFIDRVIVRRFNLFTIVIIELAMISLVWFFLSWSNKAATLIVKTNQDHFIVVFMEGGAHLDSFTYTTFFKKELIVENESCIVLDKSLQYFDELEIKPHLWKNYSMKSEDIYINGSLRTVNIYWTGNRDGNANKFLHCLDTL
jgi:hypothetical protein